MTDRDHSRKTGPTSELGFLCAVLHNAGAEMIRWGDDVDGRILQAHAAQLLLGKEWPTELDEITSTYDFEGSG